MIFHDAPLFTSWPFQRTFAAQTAQQQPYRGQKGCDPFGTIDQDHNRDREPRRANLLRTNWLRCWNDMRYQNGIADENSPLSPRQQEAAMLLNTLRVAEELSALPIEV